MNFSAVVEKARQLVTRGGLDKGQDTFREAPDSSGGSEGPGDVIYGRVCTTVGGESPLMLSSDPNRKSVFLFGPDAVEAIVVKQAAYNILCSIGRDKDYLYHMVGQLTPPDQIQGSARARLTRS